MIYYFVQEFFAIMSKQQPKAAWRRLLDDVDLTGGECSSDRTQTAIIAHYAVSNAKHLTVDHV